MELVPVVYCGTHDQVEVQLGDSLVESAWWTASWGVPVEVPASLAYGGGREVDVDDDGNEVVIHPGYTGLLHQDAWWLADDPALTEFADAITELATARDGAEASQVSEDDAGNLPADTSPPPADATDPEPTEPVELDKPRRGRRGATTEEA